MAAERTAHARSRESGSHAAWLLLEHRPEGEKQQGS